MPADMTFSLSHISKSAIAIILIAMNSVVSQADESRPTADQLHFFETHIRPLLHAKCVKCHGENQQKGELRLDSIESLFKGGESGPAAVAGKPADSLLLEAVRYESFEMPPDKPLSAEEISALEKWIADGAAWPRVDGQSVRLSGAAFTNEERSFWSLQPLTHPEPPEQSSQWGNNAIDRFVAAKLNENKISPAPRADERTLVRRLYFGLLGLPPSPDEVSDLKFQVSDSNTEESDRESEISNSKSQISDLVNRLLDDPRYGEHWGRYWLDIVRYAESDGFRADTYRDNAWRYRDYVVNAFNKDKPYDQFVLEQLAGDEYAPDKAEALVATGYLRTYLYEYNQRDARTQWQDILNQVTDVTGEAFLGIGVGCARCHDHKFDPILQEDYYRLRAAFGTMIPRDDIPAADLVDRQRYRKDYKDWLAKGVELRAELKQLQKPYLENAAKKCIIMFPEDIQVIMAKPEQQRNPLENQLADLVNRQILFEEGRVKYKEDDKKRIDELKKQIAELAGAEPSGLPTAITVADVGTEPFPLHVGGNEKRKAVVAGGFSILDPKPFSPQPTKSSTGQRSALAKWIADSGNPLTARVLVNRVWQKHFGTGLVETASDFGSLGGRPSHPKLLDWLASEFVANDWSIKWLHRQILTSATWQMSSVHPDAVAAEVMDPGNRLRWRFDIRRLNAEQIRDAMLTVSGELNEKQGGASVAHTSLRRSLYLKAMRNTPEPLMRSLDGVDGLNSISKRSTTTTPTQALNLMNGDWVRERSIAMAKRILKSSHDQNPTRIVNDAFQTALGRSIEADEIPVAVDLLERSLGTNANSAETADFGSLAEDSGNSAIFGEHALSALATKGNQPAVAAPFSFVGIIKLDSLYADATVRTIVSQWDSNSKSRGWALGVTSTKSGYKPRNFILQVVGEGGYEVVASNLRPELDVPYFAAVTVEQTDDGKGKATFWLQSLDSKYGKLETAEVTFKTSKGIQGAFPVVLGGRTKQSRHRWDGQLDQAAMFNTALTAKTVEALFASRLTTAAIEGQQPVALWDFENPEARMADATPNGHHLTLDGKQTLKPLEKSVAELCHVLLNSNEFVYID